MTVEVAEHAAINFVGSPFGWLLLAIFVVGYYFIATEEKYHIDKAKPALFTGT
ncbi:MAG: sodium:proton antiporter, partial [Sulfuricurvum sp.]